MKLRGNKHFGGLWIIKDKKKEKREKKTAENE